MKWITSPLDGWSIGFRRAEGLHLGFRHWGIQPVEVDRFLIVFLQGVVGGISGVMSETRSGILLESLTYVSPLYFRCGWNTCSTPMLGRNIIKGTIPLSNQLGPFNVHQPGEVALHCILL